jgi:hypothetical protein
VHAKKPFAAMDVGSGCIEHAALVFPSDNTELLFNKRWLSTGIAKDSWTDLYQPLKVL